MKKIIILSVFLAVFTVSSFADDPTPEQLSDKIRSAGDPNGAFRKASSYVIRQKLTIEGGEKKGSFEIEIKFKRAPDRSRTTWTFNGKMMSSLIFKDGKAWNISGVDSSVIEITGNSLERLKLFSQIADPSASLTQIFETLKINLKNEDGKDYYVIECRPKHEDLPVFTFYVATDNFLQYKLITSTDKGEPYSAIITKYSLVEEVMLPSETTVKSGGLIQKILLENFKLNVDIPDSDFDIPSNK